MARPPDFSDKLHFHDQFINGRAKLLPAKTGPMAVLSTQGPMAVLSRQKQPDGHTSRFQRQIAFSTLSRKQAQWPFYQREAQWPFYQGRSNRMARPPDFSDKLHFRYYPTRSVYQRPSQAILRKSRPNGRFIKAEATGWPRPPDFSDKLHFRYYPARSIYQRPGQAILSKSRPNGRFINAGPNSRFIKAEATGWPDLQISATNCIFAIIRTISLSAAGPSYSQQKQAQWPFYQREAQWPFYQEQRPDSQTPDLSRGLQVPYYPAQSV